MSTTSTATSIEVRHRFCSVCGLMMRWVNWIPGYSRATGDPFRRAAWVCSTTERPKGTGYPYSGAHDGPPGMWGWDWDDDLETHYNGYIRKGHDGWCHQCIELGEAGDIEGKLRHHQQDHGAP